MERIYDNELGLGLVDPVIEGFAPVVAVNGDAAVAGVEGDVGAGIGTGELFGAGRCIGLDDGE